MQPGNVRLIQRGSRPATWLYGRTFEEPAAQPKDRQGRGKGGKGKRRRGQVIDASEIRPCLPKTISEQLNDDKSESVRVKIKYSNGHVEAVPYELVASTVLLTRHKECLRSGIVKTWPRAEAGDIAQSTKKTEKKSEKELLSLRKPWPKGRSKEPKASMKRSHSSSLMKSEGRTVAVTPPTAESDEDEDCDDLELEALNISRDLITDNMKLSPPRKRKVREMLSSLGNSLWRALNSAEPHTGLILLRHELTVHNSVPNLTLSKNLWDLVRDGPKSEGVAFRDPNRTELGRRYLALLLTAENGPWKSVPDSLTAGAEFGPFLWENLECVLRAPLDETEQVNMANPQPSSLRRIGQSLQVATCGLWCILKLLQRELVCANMVELSKGAEKLSPCSGPMARMLKDRCIREALKLAARCAASCWARHGHWILGAPPGCEAVEQKTSSESQRQFCADEAKGCLDYLGRIVSHMLLLFNIEEGLVCGGDEGALAIRDAVLSEIDCTNHDTDDEDPGMLEARSRYFHRLKLRFVLSLSEDCAEPLKRKLAELLGVLSEFSIVMGTGQ